MLGLLPSVASTIGYSLGYSGTAGAVWGWLVASLFIQATAFSMAELCSSMPTAGGLYYAAAALAPEGWGPLASWVVGWCVLFLFFFFFPRFSSSFLLFESICFFLLFRRGVGLDWVDYGLFWAEMDGWAEGFLGSVSYFACCPFPLPLFSLVRS